MKVSHIASPILGLSFTWLSHQYGCRRCASPTFAARWSGLLEKLWVESVACKGTRLESLRLSEVVGMEIASLFFTTIETGQKQGFCHSHDTYIRFCFWIEVSCLHSWLEVPMSRNEAFETSLAARMTD